MQRRVLRRTRIFKFRRKSRISQNYDFLKRVEIAERTGRTPHLPLENFDEISAVIETDFFCNGLHGFVCRKKFVLPALDTKAVEMFDKVFAGDFFEKFAEITCTDVAHRRKSLKFHGRSIVVVYVVYRGLNNRRVFIDASERLIFRQCAVPGLRQNVGQAVIAKVIYKADVCVKVGFRHKGEFIVISFCVFGEVDRAFFGKDFLDMRFVRLGQ